MVEAVADTTFSYSFSISHKHDCRNTPGLTIERLAFQQGKLSLKSVEEDVSIKSASHFSPIENRLYPWFTKRSGIELMREALLRRTGRIPGDRRASLRN